MAHGKAVSEQVQEGRCSHLCSTVVWQRRRGGDIRNLPNSLWIRHICLYWQPRRGADILYGDEQDIIIIRYSQDKLCAITNYVRTK